MISAPLARASLTSFATFGTEAVQRGRCSLLQVWLVKSITSSAVSLGTAIFAGLSCGGAGSLAVAHSSTMVCARAGMARLTVAGRKPTDVSMKESMTEIERMRCMVSQRDGSRDYRAAATSVRVMRGGLQCVGWGGAGMTA